MESGISTTCDKGYGVSAPTLKHGPYWLPVNNWGSWRDFRDWGCYVPTNDNGAS